MPWSIMYVADNKLFTMGPYLSEDDAIDEARRIVGLGAFGNDFDIDSDAVYLVSPHHEKTELTREFLEVTPEWVVDECPDADGYFTIRIADGSPNGSVEKQPIATVYIRDDAERIVKLHNEAL